jgi:hypothetical protein
MRKLQDRAILHTVNAQASNFSDRLELNVHKTTAHILEAYADPSHIDDLLPDSQWKTPRAGVVEHYARKFHDSNKATSFVGKNTNEVFRMFEDQGFARKTRNAVARGRVYTVMNLPGLPLVAIHQLKFKPIC